MIKWITLVLLVALILRVSLNFPITSQDAASSHKAFSVVSFNQNLNLNYENKSILVDFLRIPFIKIFGLNNFGVRIVSIVLGLVWIGVFIYWLKQIRKKLNIPENDIKSQPNARIIQDFRDRDGNISARIVALE